MRGGSGMVKTREIETHLYTSTAAGWP
jgi:hypothetical protein